MHHLHPMIVCIFVMYTGIVGSDAIAGDQLLNVGVIQSKIRSLMYYTDGGASFIVVKLLPNLPPNNGTCNITSLDAYNVTLFKLLTPLIENLSKISAVTDTKPRRERFAGVVIGLAALGVATAAQITAAVAIVKANANAAAINNLASSIQSTNKAVSDVITASRTIATAVQAIQDHINGAIVNGITSASCRAHDALIGSILNLYLTELTTIFHNQITNPALTPLSIQALRILLGSTLPIVIESKLNTKLNTAELLSSGLLTGQIISISPMYMQMLIQINVPTFIMQPGAKVIDLIAISANHKLQEVVVQVPNRILEYANELQNYPANDCVVTPNSVFCRYNEGSPIPESQYQCLRGNLNSCTFTPIIGNFLKRFAFANGVLYANCKSLLCKCADPPHVVSQDDNQGISIIDIKRCSEMMLDTFSFRITSTFNATYVTDFSMINANIVHLSPLDLSNQINSINKSLKSAEDWIADSNFFANQARTAKTLYSLSAIALILSVITLVVVGLLIAYIIKLVSQIHQFRALAATTMFHRENPAAFPKNNHGNIYGIS